MVDYLHAQRNIYLIVLKTEEKKNHTTVLEYEYLLRNKIHI